MPMSLQFRPARPEDVDAAIALIYSSGPAAFDYVFAGTPKGSAQDFLRKAFVSGAGQFGYRQHWLGEQDGQVVAAGTALSGEVNLRNMAVAAAQIIAFYGPRHCWQVVGSKSGRAAVGPVNRWWRVTAATRPAVSIRLALPGLVALVKGQLRPGHSRFDWPVVLRLLRV